MLAKIKNAWLRFARVISAFNSYILLTVAYLLVVIPIGSLFRITGKSMTVNHRAKTYWIKRSGESSLEKPF